MVVEIILFLLCPHIFAQEDWGNNPNQAKIELPEGKPDMEIMPFDRVATTAGKYEYEIHAKRAFAFRKEKKYYLENIEKAAFYEEDKTYTLSADYGLWDEKEKNIELKGNLVFKIQDNKDIEDIIEIKLDRIKYSDTTKILEAETPITAKGKDFTLTGNYLTINTKLKHLQMKNQIRLEISKIPEQEKVKAEGPLIITSEFLNYFQKKNLLLFQGSPQAKWNEHHLEGGIFRVLTGEKNKVLFVEGGFKGFLSKTYQGNDVFISGGNLRFNALSYVLKMTNQVKVNSNDLNILGEEIVLILDPQTKAPKVVYLKKNGQIDYREYTLKGDRIFYNFLNQRGVITGSPVISRDQDRIAADKILVLKKGEEILFEGNVRGKFLPRKGEFKSLFAPGSKMESYANTEEPIEVKGRMAFIQAEAGLATFIGNVVFSRGDRSLQAEKVSFKTKKNPSTGKDELYSIIAEPQVQIVDDKINVYAERAEYIADGSMVILNGNCHLWQDIDSIKSRRMIVYPEDNYIIADGNITAVIFQRAREEKISRTALGSLGIGYGPGPIEITAKRVDYSQNDNLIVFQGKVKAKHQDSVLQAERLDIILNDKGELSAFLAYKDVRLKDADREGVGDKIIYNSKHGVAILTGTPCALWERQRGIKGKTAFFWEKDKRYVMDGMKDDLSEALYFYQGELPPLDKGSKPEKTSSDAGKSR